MARAGSRALPRQRSETQSSAFREDRGADRGPGSDRGAGGDRGGAGDKGAQGDQTHNNPAERTAR